MSWYRTYRPQQVSQLHLTYVREQLLSILKSGKIPHALLFSGPKGTGKTSSARILAKVVNCDKNSTVKEGDSLHEPCGKCEMCVSITNGSSLNVIEMDAASNRRIDDVRELRAKIYIPPAQGKKLVYIIDEVHMLTKEAFNALLKILEEPPTHVLFILATTEQHKIPETIQSRCTQVIFQKATPEEIQDSLGGIAKQENLTVEPEVFVTIAQHADGSFRDAVKVFEQLVEQSGKKNITQDYALSELKAISSGDIEQLVRVILAKDEKKVVQQFVRWQEQDISPTVIHEQLLGFLHHELLKSLGIESGESITTTTVLQFLLKHFGTILCDTRLPYPLLPLEMEIIELILKSKAQKNSSSGNSSSNSPEISKNSSLKKTTVIESKEKNESDNEQKKIQVTESVIEFTGDTLNSPYQLDTVVKKEEEKVEEVVISENYVNAQPLADKWNDLLNLVGKQNLSVEALLRSSQFLSGAEGIARIQVFYQFHKEQLELDRYRLIIETSIEQLLGGRVKVEYELTKNAVQKGLSTDSNLSGKVDDDLANLAEELVASA